MAQRIIFVVAMILFGSIQLAVGVPALAQTGEAAESVDLGTVVQRLVKASRATEYDTVTNGFAKDLEEIALWVEGRGIANLTPRQAARITGKAKVSFRERLLWNRDEFVPSPNLAMPTPAEVDSILDALQTAVNWEGGLEAYLTSRISAEELTDLVEPIGVIHVKQLNFSLAESFKKLDQYEKKFGPTSARLNFVESLLNLGLAHWSKFGPDNEGWPGPWEAIAAYSNSYGSYDGEEIVTTSALELGLRRYLFSAGWGEGKGVAGQLKPSYYSVGVLLAGAGDGPLVEPWKGDQRVGAFVSWGSIKAAYLFTEGDKRWLVSKQFQFVPWLF